MFEEAKKRELTDTTCNYLSSHLKCEAPDSHNVLSEDLYNSTWTWTSSKLHKTSSLLILL